MRLFFHSRGQNTEVRDAANNVSSATYDLLGNVTRLAGPLGGATNYTYDNMGRLIAESTCLGGESGKIYSMTTKADRPEPFEAGEFENKERVIR